MVQASSNMLPNCRYQTRVLYGGSDDLGPALHLRALAFRDGADDRDDFDPICDHVLVENVASGQAVCCFRLLSFDDGTDICRSYSGQYYDLTAMQKFDQPMVEMGRFCMHPEVRDPDVLRIAWGAMVRYVDDKGAKMLIGCSSFAGTDATTYKDAFSILAERHLAPKHWMPGVKAPGVVRFGDQMQHGTVDRKAALKRMPPLLKTYLTMGGWVSDHAVVDHDLSTLHVFTGLEIGSIPLARIKALRAGA